MSLTLLFCSQLYSTQVPVLSNATDIVGRYSADHFIWSKESFTFEGISSGMPICLTTNNKTKTLGCLPLQKVHYAILRKEILVQVRTSNNTHMEIRYNTTEIKVK